MKIYLLRHAETEHNLNKIIQGSIDTSLNHTGHEQAGCLAQHLASIHPSAIYCSDLKRCRETLQHVLDKYKDKQNVVYTERLRERYMAELQGISKDEADRLCLQQEKTRYDFGEGTQALIDRVEGFWNQEILPLYRQKKTNGCTSSHSIEAAEREEDTLQGSDRFEEDSVSDNEETIFICSHGGTLLQLTKVLTSTFGFRLGPDQEIVRASPNTAITILDTTTMTVERLADISHLEQLSTEEKKETAKLEVVDA